MLKRSLSNTVPRSITKKTSGLFTLIWFLLVVLMTLAGCHTGGILNKGLENNTRHDLLEAPPSIYNHLRKRLLKDVKNEHTENKKYDILINSYMRSGSSFTGQLLAFNPNTFYWYEPIWASHGVFYFLGHYVCVGVNRCGDIGRGKIEVIYNLLQSIYSCNLKPVQKAVADLVTPFHSGESWKPYTDCREKNASVSSCLTIMEDTCKRSKHRATKVVRLTVDNLEHILNHQPNVKAIHLIRDPRAIINSRLTTKWFNMSDTEQNIIKDEAQDLCSRMKYDLLQGEKLKRKYPKRFAFVMFEDLQDDLKYKTEMLYSYFGINKADIDSESGSISGILQEDHKVNRTKGDYSNWWRFQLGFKKVNVIDSVCGSVLSFLGYRIFLDESELKDMSNKAYQLRKDLLLSNLNENKFYDFATLYNSNPYRREIDILSRDGTKITGERTLVI